jgi:ppGpp synthetase/RelA/SpoT-type nucleotidyltranferase
MGLSEEDISFIKENLKEPHNTVERYEEFFIPKLQMHTALCTTVIVEINRLLNPVITEHSNRFFCRIDDSHSIKLPDSIVEKMRRSQVEAKKKKDKGEEPTNTFTIDNFNKTMTDLARFRVVCNFLSDVNKVADLIKGSDNLNKYFSFLPEKNSINLHKRVTGERSIKFVIEYKSQPGLFIEIQVMTQLQEAWDKKDHYLVYEKKRSSQKTEEELFSNYLDSKMSAMSELLYVADDYFEKLRKDAEETEE